MTRQLCARILVAGATMAYCGRPKRHRGPCVIGWWRDHTCTTHRRETK